MDKKYKFIWKEKRSIINVESHIRMYIHHRDILGNQHNHSVIFANDLVAEEFHLRNDNKDWINQGNQLLKKNFITNHIEQGKQIRNQYKQFIISLNRKKLHLLDEDKISQLFIKSCHFHSRLRGFFKTTCGEFLQEAEIRLKKIIKKYIHKESEHQLIFETLTTPSKLDNVNYEFSDWIKLISSNNKCDKNIINHIYKYPWLVASTYNLDEIIKMIQNKYKNDREERIKLTIEHLNLKKKKEKLRKQQYYLHKKFDNKNLNFLAWLFKEISIERMRLKGGWAGSDLLHLPLYKEISRRTLIPLDHLYTVYRIEEVLSLIRNKQLILNKNEIKNRRSSYVFLLHKKKLKFYSGHEAKKIIEDKFNKLSKPNSNNISLKGQSASLGQVRGKVRIIIPGDINMQTEALSKFREGEIIVSTMTQPNILPIMKKAKAFITDEGGLTSHAAIIARELEIPCVVGTEIATKVLKDGDTVFVDATKGVVNKI